MKKYCIVLFLVFTVTAFAQKRALSTDTNRTISVKPDAAEFSITVLSNPSTGYSWFLKQYDTNLVMPLKHTYKASEKKIPGAGGHDSWSFKVKKDAFIVPRVTSVVLEYRRPWEVKKGHEQTFVVVIVGK